MSQQIKILLNYHTINLCQNSVEERRGSFPSRLNFSSVFSDLITFRVWSEVLPLNELCIMSDGREEWLERERERGREGRQAGRKRQKSAGETWQAWPQKSLPLPPPHPPPQKPWNSDRLKEAPESPSRERGGRGTSRGERADQQCMTSTLLLLLLLLLTPG